MTESLVAVLLMALVVAMMIWRGLGVSKPGVRDSRKLLESERIDWKRDWDAVAIGFVLGVLVTLVVQGGW